MITRFESVWVGRGFVIACVLVVCGMAASEGQEPNPARPSRQSLANGVKVIPKQDLYSINMAGQQLSSGEAEGLEQQVVANPDDVDARTALLGYYSLRSYGSKAARASRQEHIVWLIQYRPESPVHQAGFVCLDPILDGAAYEQGKRVWLDHVAAQSSNPVILGNAARFLFIYEPAKAEDLLRRAEAVDPANPGWSKRLGLLYSLRVSGTEGEARQAAAQAALGVLERSFALDTDEGRFAELAGLAKTSFEAGAPDKARWYAEELLARANEIGPGHWNYGNAIHHGNLVLGRLALASGDTPKARDHLLAAGHTPGSPQLDTFGPKMTLARDLLEKGERDAVLEYLDSCRRFWKRKELDEWARDVRAGKMPQFGANLGD